jgi:hypothetical protein
VLILSSSASRRRAFAPPPGYGLPGLPAATCCPWRPPVPPTLPTLPAPPLRFTGATHTRRHHVDGQAPHTNTHRRREHTHRRRDDVAWKALPARDSLRRAPALPHIPFLQQREFALFSARRCSQDIADEAQKAETGPVFNRTWCIMLGGLEYLSGSCSSSWLEHGALQPAEVVSAS